jgi:uncharacterized membrane protein (DUF373 family)
VSLLEIDQILELFALFLLVLIGIELMHSVKVYIKRREVHLETMFVVALVAVVTCGPQEWGARRPTRRRC